MEGGEQSFLFSSVTFFLSLAHTSCFSQQFWKNFRKRIYYQPLQMLLQLAPAAADPFPLGLSAPFRCPRLVPGASWYRGGRACLAVFLSFQEKFDIVVSFVRNVSLEKEMYFPSKKAGHKESPRRQKATSGGATWGQGLLGPSPVRSPSYRHNALSCVFVLLFPVGFRTFNKREGESGVSPRVPRKK